MTTPFKCAKCKEIFYGNGLRAVVNEQTAGNVCPACLANAERITIVLERSTPRKPYKIAYTEIEPFKEIASSS